MARYQTMSPGSYLQMGSDTGRAAGWAANRPWMKTRAPKTDGRNAARGIFRGGVLCLAFYLVLGAALVA